MTTPTITNLSVLLLALLPWPWIFFIPYRCPSVLPSYLPTYLRLNLSSWYYVQRLQRGPPPPGALSDLDLLEKAKDYAKEAEVGVVTA